MEKITSGDDHLLMLNNQGKVYSMGDDTYGQCGLGKMERSEGGPFVEAKIKNPTIVEAFMNIPVEKIYSNGDHNFVITKNKDVIGWGSNSHL